MTRRSVVWLHPGTRSWNLEGPREEWWHALPEHEADPHATWTLEDLLRSSAPPPPRVQVPVDLRLAVRLQAVAWGTTCMAELDGTLFVALRAPSLPPNRFDRACAQRLGFILTDPT